MFVLKAALETGQLFILISNYFERKRYAFGAKK